MINLYSLDKKGKIRVFKGEVTTNMNNMYVETFSGLLGGNLVSKQLLISKGKQKRTIEEQAKFELDSLVNEKLDEGYKSWQMLQDRKEALGLANQDDAGGPPLQEGKRGVELLFYTLGIKYNTNKYWLPLPMLAEKWKEKKHLVNYPALIQSKLNGVRCIAIWSDNQVKLLSRGGQIYIMPHIKAQLYPLLSKYTNLVLDGELYKHGMPLQKIAGIVKLEDSSKFQRKEVIEYWVYDLAEEDTSQSARIAKRDAFILANDLGDHIKILPTKSIHNEADVQKYHDISVEAGYEGAIVRNPHSSYKFGFRDSCLLKVKEFIDEEFEIKGCEVDADKGIESFVFVLYNNQGKMIAKEYAQTFKARPTGTLEDKAIWYSKIKNYIGKMATVRYQERTSDGIPHQGHLQHKLTEVLVEAIRDYE